MLSVNHCSCFSPQQWSMRATRFTFKHLPSPLKSPSYFVKSPSIPFLSVVCCANNTKSVITSTTSLSDPKAIEQSSSKGITPIPSTSTGEGKEVKVQHIMVYEDELELLEELEKKLIEEGVDFSELAKEHSVCQSKKRGGMLGWLREGQCAHIPEFEEAIFNSSVNNFIKCKTKLGWHLVQVVDERRGVLQGIEPDDFYPKMQDRQFLESNQLIDVREPLELNYAYLSGFKNCPLSRAKEWLFAPTINLDPDKDTYVLCHVGKEAPKVAEMLKARGFKRVYYILGGIHEYARVAYSRDPDLVLRPY